MEDASDAGHGNLVIDHRLAVSELLRLLFLEGVQKEWNDSKGPQKSNIGIINSRRKNKSLNIQKGFEGLGF